MFANLHAFEIVLVILVIVVVFGGKRLPELGKGLGQGLKNFRSALSGKDDHSPPPTEKSTDPKTASQNQPTDQKAANPTEPSGQ